MDAAYANQNPYTVRCEWGLQGLATLGPHSGLVIIVDVLSFSTSVDLAVANGALIYPWPWKDASAEQFAASIQALLAHTRQPDTGGYSLSPSSLRSIPAGTRLVLPSPNGATLSHAAGSVPTIAGCLRNARAVARVAESFERISVIAAGERWPDGSLRPAIEDWIGAGAIIAHLTGNRSPEADLAALAFAQAAPELPHYLHTCSSGRELIERGYAEDIALAAALDSSSSVPFLIDGAYQRSPA